MPNTHKTDIKVFIGLLYLAGALRNNTQGLQERWGTDGDGTEKFHLVMKQRCFKFLIRCIQSDDRTTREDRKQNKIAMP
jgi:hypothetical protein